jgi:peptidoglycan/xylan/chitin deacetylase (PgdA/CDA1 family)
MQTVTILLYHKVSRDSGKVVNNTVNVDNFVAQMQYLAQHNIKVLTLDDYVKLHRANQHLESPAVVLTFDDGFTTTCSLVEEALAKFNYTATLFLALNHVATPDSREDILSWEYLRTLKNIDVQAHTVSHPRLSQVTGTQVRQEVRDCKTIIEQEMGRAINHFAYPVGGYNADVVQEVRAAGYHSACAVESGNANLNSNLFRLPRINIYGNDNLEVFSRKVRFGYGSPRKQAIGTVRHLLYRVPGLHDLVEKKYPRLAT